MHEYLIGIDGGGTRCRARLTTNEGRVIGQGLSGPANIQLGLDYSWRNISEAIDRALDQAGLDRHLFPRCRLGLGLAGVVTEADRQQVAAKAAAFHSVKVATDAHTACLGAFGGRDGAIFIGGTGSVGYAWLSGESHQVGGWGFTLGDEGSGATLGRQALRYALMARDGLIEGTALTERVNRFFTSAGIDLQTWLATARPTDFGTFAPDVMELAERGDPWALDILKINVGWLETYVRRLTRLGAPRVCLLGGVAPRYMPYLSEEALSLIADAQGDALDGALLMCTGLSEGQLPGGLDIPQLVN
ncbi:BadF/BadG/BcrA/BcrD ATPase family protein [Asticcacaulis sp. DXS10W]|uniref:BadF/BadG/BcrA/BcrD ATPase family protein n=1 Tax=Asticcacaulis currens TaxID=2984210 RepID=A0ABT5IDN5_9CAUL|nr:BadF/BadG/BcrA/BcrD ATPase family protein [Asticcacaulis currens]MDC7694307.1 BadF/BadG/BcrA/BcrD ATPase family protein [Asticcacaulis currens]